MFTAQCPSHVACINPPEFVLSISFTSCYFECSFHINLFCSLSVWTLSLCRSQFVWFVLKGLSKGQVRLQLAFSCWVLALDPRVNPVCQRMLCVFLPCEVAVVAVVPVCHDEGTKRDNLSHLKWLSILFDGPYKGLSLQSSATGASARKLVYRSHLLAYPQLSVHVVCAFLFFFFIVTFVFSLKCALLLFCTNLWTALFSYI